MRTNLKVPFADKDEARRLGARWDAARKIWYIQNVENIEQFVRWMAPGTTKPAATVPVEKKVRPPPAPKTTQGAAFFSIRCDCLPWEPCQSCLAAVASAGWGEPVARQVEDGPDQFSLMI
jgi:hypothetical protein